MFDKNGILLDVFPTTVGKEELLYYPRATKLNIVATANIDPGQMDLTPVTVGTTKIDEVEAILRQAGNYLSHNYYSYPADIFSGKLTIDNVDTQGTVDLPIRRLVSAVMVRIKGLKEHIDAPAATDDDFVVILSTQYNKVNFHGQAGLSTRSDCPVPDKLTGISRRAYGKEYHEFPGQTSGDRTDYVRIISTYEGSAVTVGVYYKDQPVAGTPITTYSDGSPIMVVHDQLNVIVIYFQSVAGCNVQLRIAPWNGGLEIEKDF